MHTAISSSRLLRPARLGLAALALFTGALLPAQTSPITLLPREGSGLGTVSAYAGVQPVIATDAAGVDSITLPASDKNEVNLVWTFWGHTQPGDSVWPVGQKARSTFTVVADSDTILTFRIGVRVANEWTELIPAPEVTFTANKPQVVTLPLPDTIPVGSVETIRVKINSHGSVPELRFTRWTIGTQK